MADPIEAEIVVDPDDGPNSTAKRPIRAVKPTIKIRTATRQEEETAQQPKRTIRTAMRSISTEGSTERTSDTRRSSSGGGSSGSNDGRAMLQKALELLVESRTESQWLREALERQEETIRDLSLKLDDTIKRMNEELKQSREELKLVREQLETMAANATHSLPLSYADAARSAPSSQPTNLRTLSSFNTTPSNFSDTLYCIINTAYAESEAID